MTNYLDRHSRRHQPSVRSRPPTAIRQQFDEMVITDARRMLRRYGWLILTCAIAGLVVASTYLLVKAPLFEATAEIEVRPAGSNSLGLDEMAAKLFSPTESNTELQSAVQVLQSNTIALDVMQQLGMAQRSEFAGRWRQDRGAKVEALAPELRDELLRRFHKCLSVSIVPKTDIVMVHFKSRSAELSAAAANAVIETYTQRKISTSYDSAMRVSDWLTSQMEDLKRKANESQEKLAELQRTTGLIGEDENRNIVTQKLEQLDEQLTKAQTDRVVKEARYRIATSGNPELLVSVAPDPTMQLLRTQEAELRLQYTQLSTKFGNGYPKLAEVSAQATRVDQAIDVELNRLTERYRNEYVAAEQAEKSLRGAFEEQKQKAFDLNHGAAQYAILRHEVEATRNLYETLQRKLKEAGISAGLASANIGLVDAAHVPAHPVEPRIPMVLGLGLGAGLLAGAFGVTVLEATDTSVRTGEEAEAVCEVPTLATIPRMEGEDTSRWDPSGAEQAGPPVRVIMQQEPYSMAAESYRTLRSSLLLGDARDAKVLVITSALPGEGKTMTALNFATALAQQGARVLLVDADLRRPVLHELLQVRREPGLGEVLSGRCRAEVAAVKVAGIPRLSVVSAGNEVEYPSEALASREMAEALQTWRGMYDHVVLDTPPVAKVTDAVVLAPKADAVLLVAKASSTGRQPLLRARNLLLRANARIAGVVVNCVEGGRNDGYYDEYRSSEDEDVPELRA